MSDKKMNKMEKRETEQKQEEGQKKIKEKGR